MWFAFPSIIQYAFLSSDTETALCAAQFTKISHSPLIFENMICLAFCSSSTTSAVRVFLLVAQNRCIQPDTPTATGVVAIKSIQ